MADGIEQLQETLRQQILAMFQTRLAPANGAAEPADADALAFEPIGVPLPTSRFTLDDAADTVSPDLAMETLTALADAVPEVADGAYRRTLRTISGAYSQTLSAFPLPGQAPEAIASIEQNRANANHAFEQAKRTSLGQGGDIWPVLAIPGGWFELDADVWTNFSSSAKVDQPADATTTTTPPPAAPPRFQPPSQPAWRWKVLPPAERLRLMSELNKRASVIDAQPDPGDAAPAAPAPAAGGMHIAAMALRPRIAMAAAGSGGPPPPAGTPLMTHIALRPDQIRRLVAFRPDVILQHAEPPTPVEVKPASLVMTFQACVVTLARPWINWPWLDTRGWYLPGYRAGQLTLEHQPLHRVPISAILVRNLVLSANGVIDDSLKDAVSFGPFQFIGQQVKVQNNGTSFDVAVECKTPQLIAWVTQLLTGLPPKSDPAVPET